MKKGTCWFSFLTKKEQEAFKVNFEKFRFTTSKSFEDYIKADYESFKDFIDWSFAFFRTKEGGSYWYGISYRKTD